MQVTYERCCGIDVHKKTIVACVIISGQEDKTQKETRTFDTMTDNLTALTNWLKELRITHVAMESTGVYWKPVFNLLEGQFEILVVNAEHLKKVAGRKTDVQDAEWIADLLRHGLLKGSFIPSARQRAWRDLTRYRTRLIEGRTEEVNRLQKVLEGANIKLSSVVSDVTGVSGRAILSALLDGQQTPVQMAELAKGRLRKKQGELSRALEGMLQPHHRFMVVELLGHIDYLDESIERLDTEIADEMRPFEAELEQLDSIPGVNRRVAEILAAEVGLDMKPFPDAEHMASWGGMCPGNKSSAGKRYSGKTRKGSKWLRRAVTEAAHGAARKKNQYLKSQFHRLAGRRGKKRAIIAVGHSILKIVYYILTRHQTYQDLGENYFDEREKEAVKRRSIKRLEKLGFKVNLSPVAVIA